MPELRKDPVIGRWVIIATERARRPGNIIDSGRGGLAPSGLPCRFCGPEAAPLYIARRDDSAAGAGEWDVCVIPDGEFPQSADAAFPRHKRGLYGVIEGIGPNEIIIETPRHVANMADLDIGQIRLVLETYAARINEFQKNEHIQYVLAYKSYRWSPGAEETSHSRSHIMAAPVRPLHVKEKLIGAKEYFCANNRCVYCDFIRQERDHKERVILETENFLAVTPFAARFLFEVWILPKKHHCDFAQGVSGLEQDLAVILRAMLVKFKKGLEDPAYNFTIQTAPFQRHYHAGKKWRTLREDYHWHIELVPRLTRMAGFEKGTDFYIGSIPPEETAAYLRGIDIS